MKIKCTIKQLYDYNESHAHVLDNKVKVNGRFGYNKVNTVAITAVNSKQIEISTKTKKIICSPDHRLFTTDWTHVKNLNVGDFLQTIDGEEEIINIKHFKTTADLYDLDVDKVHEFYANGIVSHNSSLAHVVQFLLYGKIDNVKNTDLANRINKSFWGKIDVDCSGHLLEIERGLYPTLFSLKVDGENYDVAGKLNVQQMIEEKYFKINYNLFKTLIILNINDFKSLIDLTPADKKKIIDKIFGFGLINQIFDTVKNTFNELNNSISNINTEISLLEENIESTKNKINNSKSINNKEQIDKYNKQLLELKAEFEKINQTKLKLDQINTTLNDDLKNNKLQVQIIDKDIAQLNKKINLFKSGICPLCGSELTGDHYKDEINKINSEIATLENNKEQLVNCQSELCSKLATVREKFVVINNKIDNVSKSIISIKANSTAIEKIQESKSSIEDLLTEFQNKLNNLNNIRIETDNKIEFIKIVMGIFSNDGVKKYVNQIYTPMINKIILDISEKLNLFYKIEFDDEFNCKIWSNGIEVNYSTLSSGEKRKLDFTIIVSFIKLLKLQSMSSNVMFLDEVFATLDLSAIDNMIDILKDLSVEINCNIFLIHHSELEPTRFDSVYEITKPTMFSELNKII